MKLFEQHMEDVYRSAARDKGPAASWAASEQLTDLLAMADPAFAATAPHELEHMSIKAKVRDHRGDEKEINEFVKAKEKFFVLPRYGQRKGTLDRELFDLSPEALRARGRS
jgi:hypothetical protein